MLDEAEPFRWPPRSSSFLFYREINVERNKKHSCALGRGLVDSPGGCSLAVVARFAWTQAGQLCGVFAYVFDSRSGRSQLMDASCAKGQGG